MDRFDFVEHEVDPPEMIKTSDGDYIIYYDMVEFIDSLQQTLICVNNYWHPPEVTEKINNAIRKIENERKRI